MQKTILWHAHGSICIATIIPITSQLFVRMSTPATIGCVAMLIYASYHSALWAFPLFRDLVDIVSYGSIVQHPKRNTFTCIAQYSVLIWGITLCAMTLWDFLSNYYGQTQLFPFNHVYCSERDLCEILVGLGSCVWFVSLASRVEQCVPSSMDVFLLDVFLWGVMRNRRERCFSHGRLDNTDMHVGLHVIWWVLHVLALLKPKESRVVEAVAGGIPERIMMTMEDSPEFAADGG